MAMSSEAESGGSAVDGSLVRQKIGPYAGAMVLVMLFGRQGWLLWQRSRVVFAWLLSSPTPMWRDVPPGKSILRRPAD
jgi:hypothetical protein